MGALLARINGNHVSRKEGMFYKAYKISDTLGQKLLSVGIGKRQLYDLHQIFSAMDRDNSGEINLAEFFNYIDIKRTRFSEKAFTVMDRDGSGEVDFIEFVLAVWNYCSFSKASLVRYSFDLYDLDGSGEIEKEEASKCIREIWGDEWEHNANAQKVMAKLDALMQTTTNERLTIQLFQDFTQRHPILLFPAFQLQTEIQHRVLGTRFWQQAAKKRAQADPRALNWKTFDKMARASRRNSLKFVPTIDDVVEMDQPMLSRKRSSIHNILAKVRSRKAKVFLAEEDENGGMAGGTVHNTGATRTAVTSFTPSPTAKKTKTKQQTVEVPQRPLAVDTTMAASQPHPPQAVDTSSRSPSGGHSSPTHGNNSQHRSNSPSGKHSPTKKHKKKATHGSDEGALVVEDVGEPQIITAT